jgi:tRNA nucleotidyltransferase (CCA-adding enzyme)
VTAPDGFDDEISAVAHRVRDSLMPDGMFLLVQLKYNHVQLVARSATDNIDVSIIAKKLGGGGHNRAAAATIMDSNLEEVRSNIIDWLSGIVKPTVKVSQIMSYGVQTIDSMDPVSKAASQMQRSGHEGYPVIDSEKGKLIGLLTRRLVDRAVSHQLGDLPVKQVMRAGQITVTPSDSVEKVQRLMTEEGWGQIPVVTENENSDQDHGVIGIVTRTDLIGLLTEERSTQAEPDMRLLMKSKLPGPVWQMVKTIGKVSSERDMPLYFVGGLVRDLLVGRSPQDVDMVTEGDAIKLVRYLKDRYGGEIRSHQQFGTAKWLLDESVWKRVDPEGDVTDAPTAIDFVTARTEFYDRPSALPEVERGSIKLDLHRRDFTINTLAIRLDGAHLGELLDFYGGFRDLDQGTIRVLHSLSFIDDPTRILRAIRLEQRLGFDIESRTGELISAGLPMLDRVTGERIRNELEMCLAEDERVNIMARLAECGVLEQINSGLIWHAHTADNFVTASDLFRNKSLSGHFPDVSDVFVYFALLLIPLGNSVQKQTMSRLKVRKTTREDVSDAGNLIRQLSKLELNAKPSDIYSLLKSYKERVIVVALVIIKPSSSLGLKVSRYLSEWRYIRTSLNGNDLIERGLEPGPQIGEILQRLLIARLDGDITDEVDELRFVDELLQNEICKELDD